MDVGEGSELRDELERVLGAAPGQTARRLTKRLRSRGFEVDKSRVNSVLYRHSQLFRHDGTIPPGWSLAAEAPLDAVRDAHRLGLLHVSNWKSFEDAEVPVADVTLIFGENSSGKSSLFQALLLMRDSWGTGAFQFSARHGWYEHVVHRHDLERQIGLRAVWGTETPSAESPMVWMLGGPSDTDAYDEQGSPIAMIALSSGGRTIVLMRVSDVDVAVGSESWTAVPLKGLTFGGDAAHPTVEQAIAAFSMDEHGFPNPDEIVLQRDGGRVTAAEAVEQSRAVLRGAGELFSGLVHVGPYRWVPQRDIELGRAAVDGPWLALLRSDDDLLTEVNEWLIKFEIPYELEIVSYGNDGQDDQFELTLHRGPGGERVQLVDVGFGVSQLLPIITLLLACREQTILIEEPEAHVHPRLQSVLGELFLTSAQDYGNKLLVETHSEPILLRLQRRIAEGRADPQEIGVVHVERNGLSSTVTNVSIKADGQLDYTWPGGFFDDRMDDLIAILDPQPED